MTAPPVVVDVDAGVAEASRIMARRNLRHMPVVDAGQLVGIISRRVKRYLRSDAEIREEVVRDVFIRVLWAEPEALRCKGV
ncbi:CBS domain-containing protein [Streptomyces sp. RB6PN25]|uniref:CBS domain-containing protein n=1 Tax=Streptomyces humicola TaxID=2953240 RepID=A0ABT1Q568_9ACTN|nr:CBS domain-containing protein [Streptomyces humicola]MCQ4083902.1 CBS domain-containing protein [Streptomyces humicola]